MITQTLNLVVAMYEAIGPGFLLALVLPLLLLALLVVARATVARRGGERGGR